MDTLDRDRMITAGELSSILAHEIKNPMNSIIINMEVLKTAVHELTEDSPKQRASEKAKKYLNAIEGEILRLDKVIKGFLDFANPSQSTKIKFKLNPLIQETVDFMRNEMAQKKVKLVVDLDPHLPSFLGSPDQIKQALLNLLLNALQSLTDGGVIQVKSTFDGHYIYVSIEDNGPGIEKAILNQIFTPYFTTKARGSGLGLSIVQRVAREHDGEIRVSSEYGKGAEFVLLLPPASGNGSFR